MLQPALGYMHAGGGGGRDREPPRRARSPSEEFSSGEAEPRERLRPTWFDVTPEMVAQGLGGRSEEQTKSIILGMAGSAGAPEQGGGQLTQATRHARRVYVGGLPPSANEERISSFFSHALAAVGGARLLAAAAPFFFALAVVLHAVVIVQHASCTHTKLSAVACTSASALLFCAEMPPTRFVH